MVLTTFKAGDYKDDKILLIKNDSIIWNFFYCQYTGILFNNFTFILLFDFFRITNIHILKIKRYCKTLECVYQLQK